jgi:GNAT superfamily N-acetyltransferase
MIKEFRTDTPCAALDALYDAGAQMAAVLLFGGDRATGCTAILAYGAQQELLGAVTVCPGGQESTGPEIVGLYVREQYRKHGVGQHLIEQALLWFESHGYVLGEGAVYVSVLTDESNRLFQAVQEKRPVFRIVYYGNMMRFPQEIKKEGNHEPI